MSCRAGDEEPGLNQGLLCLRSHLFYAKQNYIAYVVDESEIDGD